MEFVKIFFVCEEDVMQTDNIITYGFFVQEALREYRNFFDSKQREPINGKNISKDEPIIMMDSTVAIGSPVNNNVEKVYCKIRHKGRGN